MARRCAAAASTLGACRRTSVFVVEHLALQIVQLGEVAVRDTQVSDARPHEMVGDHRAQRAAADQPDARGGQLLLSAHADGREHHLPAVAVEPLPRRLGLLFAADAHVAIHPTIRRPSGWDEVLAYHDDDSTRWQGLVFDHLPHSQQGPHLVSRRTVCRAPADMTVVSTSGKPGAFENGNEVKPSGASSAAAASAAPTAPEPFWTSSTISVPGSPP